MKISNLFLFISIFSKQVLALTYSISYILEKNGYVDKYDLIDSFQINNKYECLNKCTKIDICSKANILDNLCSLYKNPGEVMAEGLIGNFYRKKLNFK